MPETNANYYSCNKLPAPDGAALCVPIGKSGAFLAAAPPSMNPDRLASILKDQFKSDGDIFEISSDGIKTDIPVGAKFYDVSALLPPVVREKNHTIENFPGPNCFYAIFYAAGIIKEEPRYIDTIEFRYYLTREMTSADPSAVNAFGAIVVFHPGASLAPQDMPGVLYESGEHAALTLSAGFLFQKLGWYKSDNYEVVRFEQAMKNFDYAAWTHLDRFERGQSPAYQEYSPAFFVKRSSPLSPSQHIAIESAEAFRWLALFEFYSKKVKKYEEISGEAFLNNRLNRFTIDNMGELLRRFDDEFLKSNPANLLRLDKTIAEAYLRLKSLSVQYETMEASYSPKSIGNIDDDIKARKQLYADHYLRDRVFLKEEVYAHLQAREIPDAEREPLFVKIEAEIQRRAPSVIQAANEGTYISLEDLLDQAVHL
jgi:hypothetical protein